MKRQYIDIESRRPYVMVTWPQGNKQRCSYAIIAAQTDTLRSFSLIAMDGRKTGEVVVDNFNKHVHIKSAAFNIVRARMEMV